RVDRQPVLGDQMGDDGITVGDRLSLVDDIGQLAARRRRGIENVLVPERDAGKPQEREHLQAITVVVGDAEQLGVGVEGEHVSTVVGKARCILRQGRVWYHAQTNSEFGGSSLRLLISVAMATLVGLAAAHAQVYPSRPISMVVPFPAGGSTDAVARIVAERMRLSLASSSKMSVAPAAASASAASRARRRTATRSTSTNGTPTSGMAQRSRCRTTW